MERYTAKDAARAFEALVTAVRYVDPSLADRLELHQGSPSAGRAWRLYDGGGRTTLGLDNGYLGWSAREATMTLRALAGCLDWLAHPIYGRVYDVMAEDVAR